MPWSFWAAYAVKLAILGATLAALYGTARALRSSRIFMRGAAHYVEVLESRMLSTHAAVHLLRVGKRYLLIGGGNGVLNKLAELDAAELNDKHGVP